MRIAIIGADNTGSACAFMAAEAGHKVRLLKTSKHITHNEYIENMDGMCGGILARDFFKEGRTLTALGLSELTNEKLFYFVEKTTIVDQNSVEFI